MRIVKIFFFHCLLALVGSNQLYAQECTIYGPSSNCAGAVSDFYPDCWANNYSWYVNGVFISSTSSASFSYVFNSPGTYTVSVYYTSEGGGGIEPVGGELPVEEEGPTYNQGQSGWASTSITISAVPSTPVLSVSKTEICVPELVNFNVSNSEPGISYTWTSVPANVVSGTGTSKVATISQTTQITVTANGSGGCFAQTTRTVTLASTTATPVVSPLMEYRKTTLTASTTAGGHYWQTHPDGMDNSFANRASVPLTVHEPGEYYLRRYSASGNCWGSATGPAVAAVNYTPVLPVIEQIQHTGYNEIIFKMDDRDHILTFAEYLWMDGAEPNAAVISPCIPGICKVFAEGTFYLRGRDKGTGTWGEALPVQVSLRSDKDLNWVHSIAYDGTLAEKVIQESKAYFDEAGKPLQSQVKVIDARDNQAVVLASQSLRDRYDRVVGSTLTAPISSNEFHYAPGFVMAPDGEFYNHTHFDGEDTRYNPIPLGNQVPGTLGWYYSQHNTLESFVPTTGYPYTRMEFYEDGTGEVKQSIGVGDIFRGQQGIETLAGTFPVVDELNDYLEGRSLAIPGITDDGSLRYEGVQSVAKDENGRKVVSITDKEGKTLMTARRGTPENHVLAVINEVTASVDSGTEPRKMLYFYLLDDYEVTITGTGSYTTEEIINGEKRGYGETFEEGDGIWPAGFYRILLDSGAITLKYTHYFLDVAYLYYDDMGRLITSVSPNGFQAWKKDGAEFDEIDKTTYTYNYKGWLLSSTEPDAGKSEFKYRKDGSIRFSQNSQQAIDNTFSYTHYDAIGRPVESGEYVGDTHSFASLQNQLEYDQQEMYDEEDVRDWMKTYYDFPDPDLEQETGLPSTFTQQYIRGAVSYSENEHTKTWYSYDELGRVTWMAQKPKGLSNDSIKRVMVSQYTYDFLGTVLEARNSMYVKDGSTKETDMFYHHYEYDGGKRLKRVYTSTDGVNKALRAAYYYYLHGPLKRIELGDKVQGIDFVYNIHGWLIGINSPDPLADPGGDGISGSQHAGFRKDAFGMAIDYYESTMGGLFSTSGLLEKTNPMQYHKLPYFSTISK